LKDKADKIQDAKHQGYNNYLYLKGAQDIKKRQLLVEKGQEEERKTLKSPEITKMGKKVKSRFFDSYHSESIGNF
jgi:hypothetical protein